MTRIRTVDVIDGCVYIPKKYRKLPRVVMKDAGGTQIWTYNQKTARHCFQVFNTKHPELAPDRVSINGEVFKMRRVTESCRRFPERAGDNFKEP